MPPPKAYFRAAAKMLGLHKSSKAQWKADEEDTPTSPSFSHSNGRRLSVAHRLYVPIHIHKRSQDPSQATLAHQQHIHQYHHHHQPPESHKQQHRHSIVSSRYHPRYPPKNAVTLYRRSTLGAQSCNSGNTTTNNNSSRSNSPQPASPSLQSLYNLSSRPYPPTSISTCNGSSKLYRRSGPVSPSSSSISQFSLGNRALHRSKSVPSRERRIMRQSTAYVFDTHFLLPDTRFLNRSTSTTITTITAATKTTIPLTPIRSRSLTTSGAPTATETKPALAAHTGPDGWRETSSVPSKVAVEPDSQTGTDAPDTLSALSPPPSSLLPLSALSAQQGKVVNSDSITAKPAAADLDPTAASLESFGSILAASTQSHTVIDSVNHESTGYRSQDARVLHGQQRQWYPAADTVESAENSTPLHSFRVGQTSQVVATAPVIDSKAVSTNTTSTTTSPSTTTTTTTSPTALDAASHLPPIHATPYTNKPTALDMPSSPRCPRLPPRPAIMQRHSSIAAMSVCSMRSQSSYKSHHSNSGGYCSMSIQTYESEQSQLEANLRHHSDILPTMDEMMAKVGHCLASEGGHHCAQLVEYDAARTVAQCVEVVDPPQIAIVEPCSAKIETWVN